MSPHLPLDPLQMAVPFTESPFLERALETSSWTEHERAQIREFAERGYLVIDLEMEDFDALAERVIKNLARRYPQQDRRLMEAWYFDEDVRRIAISQKVLDLLRLLYQRDPIPFQTLNFDSGTEQPAHSDTLHFHCAPRHFMAGAWVALEDIDADCGPLFVHPGSHRLPDFTMHDLGLSSAPEEYQGYENLVREILEVEGYEREEVHLKKGQAIVWCANLFHGGSEVRVPGRTRQSQVTHYYFEDCLYYFPMASDPYVRRMCMREVIDLRSMTVVPHAYRGRVLDLEDYREVVCYPRPLPDTIRKGDVIPQPRKPSDLPDNPAERIAELEETRYFLRDKLEHMTEERRELVDMLHRTWTSLPFRFTNGVRKTLKAWRQRSSKDQPEL